MLLATTTGDFLAYTDSPAEAVRAYEGTGFTHLDYSFYSSNYPDSPFMGNDWVKQVADAARQAERLGFDFVQAHSPGNDYFRTDSEAAVKGNIRAIEACGYLGIKTLVVHSGISEKYKPKDAAAYRLAVKEFYGRLYPAMEKYGVNVLAENYTPCGDKFYAPYSGEDLINLIDVCDHPLLGVCWDVGHANLNAPDQYGDIVKLGSLLKAVHIQDNMGTQDDHLCPYMGTLDIDGVMRGLIDNGFVDRKGVFTFECDNVVARRHGWPHVRNEFGECKAAQPTLEIKKRAVCMMYEVGKNILSQYGLFEN